MTVARNIGLSQYRLEPILTMSWEINVTSEFAEWYRALSPNATRAVMDRVGLLEARGPMLGEPVVKRIKWSRHHNMKELRCGTADAIRILFIFDPERQAVLLVGGEKAGQWNEWYEVSIPKADKLYDEYLAEIRTRRGA